jgi:hypothetical protein
VKTINDAVMQVADQAIEGVFLMLRLN